MYFVTEGDEARNIYRAFVVNVCLFQHKTIIYSMSYNMSWIQYLS